MEPQQNIDVLLDYNATSCIVPFNSGGKTFDLAVKVHSQGPGDHVALNIVANIACLEPHTVVAVQNTACDGAYGGNTKFKECVLESNIRRDDVLSRCRYVCACIGSCEIIIIQQRFVEWNGDNAETYRVCNIDVT